MCVARWRCPQPGFGALAAAAAIAGTTRFPVLPPCPPAKPPQSDRCSDSLSVTTHQGVSLTTCQPCSRQDEKPSSFGGWCVSAARSCVSLLLRGVATCLGASGRTTAPPALVVKFRRGTPPCPASLFGRVTPSPCPLIGRRIT